MCPFPHCHILILLCLLFRHFQMRPTSTWVWQPTPFPSGPGWLWSMLQEGPSTTTSMTLRPSPGKYIILPEPQSLCTSLIVFISHVIKITLFSVNWLTATCTDPSYMSSTTKTMHWCSAIQSCPLFCLGSSCRSTSAGTWHIGLVLLDECCLFGETWQIVCCVLLCMMGVLSWIGVNIKFRF